MNEPIDKKIDALSVAMATGFKNINKKFEGIDNKFDEMDKKIDEKVDALAVSVAAGFEGLEKKLGGRIESLEKKVSNLPTKAYLDEKLADLKGDLVVKLRKEDNKVNFLIDLLCKKSVLTKADADHFRREFEIFPYSA